MTQYQSSLKLDNGMLGLKINNYDFVTYQVNSYLSRYLFELAPRLIMWSLPVQINT